MQLERVESWEPYSVFRESVDNNRALNRRETLRKPSKPPESPKTLNSVQPKEDGKGGGGGERLAQARRCVFHWMYNSSAESIVLLLTGTGGCRS